MRAREGHWNGSGSSTTHRACPLTSMSTSTRRCTKIRQTIVTSIGELLFIKGRIVDLVLRRVKRTIPKWSLPGAIRFWDAMKHGRKLSLSRVPLGHDDLAFLQYTGGTTGVAKGA